MDKTKFLIKECKRGIDLNNNEIKIIKLKLKNLITSNKCLNLELKELKEAESNE